MQIRSLAINHTFHVIRLHHLSVIFQRLAGALAHDLLQHMDVTAIEEHRFGGEVRFPDREYRWRC